MEEEIGQIEAGLARLDERADDLEPSG